MQRAGFTIFELVVLVVVVVASAALVYPVVTSETLRADRATAEEKCRQIAVALEHYLKDRTVEPERLPVDRLTGKRLAWLRGPGKVPRNNPFSGDGPAGDLRRVFLEKDPDRKSWGGPYLKSVEPDPWGNAYLVNIDGIFNDKERTWILSAGPDGIVDTAPESGETRGDDIGRVLP